MRIVPYSRKIWRFAFATAKLKSANISSLHTCVHMVIPYRTAKFKSANIFAMVIWGPIAYLIPVNISGYMVFLSYNIIIAVT